MKNQFSPYGMEWITFVVARVKDKTIKLSEQTVKEYQQQNSSIVIQTIVISISHTQRFFLQLYHLIPHTLLISQFRKFFIKEIQSEFAYRFLGEHKKFCCLGRLVCDCYKCVCYCDNMSVCVCVYVCLS